MRTWTRALAVVAIAALGLAGCSQGGSSVTGPSGTTGSSSGSTANLEPTLTSIQRNIFSTACTSCHTDQGRFPDGGLVLLDGRSFAQLVGVSASGRAGAVRVVAGNPDGSYLIQKLSGAPGIAGSRMPIGGPFLNDSQMQVIRRWIELGAKND